MYKTKQTQQTFQKVVKFFIMWMQKESSKSSPILSPTYLLMYHISDKMEIYYFERLILSTHLFFFFKGLRSFSAEILILHSEIYHLPSAGPLKQVFVNISWRDSHSDCHTVLPD